MVLEALSVDKHLERQRPREQPRGEKEAMTQIEGTHAKRGDAATLVRDVLLVPEPQELITCRLHIRQHDLRVSQLGSGGGVRFHLDA